MRSTAVTSLVAVLVGVLGIIGLARAAVPDHSQPNSSSGMSMSMNSAGDASVDGPITITNAYVREPASPDVAAAYFTIHNNSGSSDTLQSVLSGAGQSTSLHTDTGTTMADMPNGITVAAHSTYTLTPGKAHVMIEKLIGTLTAGQTVNLQLRFAKAGTINVVAPVIAILAPAPTSSASK